MHVLFSKCNRSGIRLSNCSIEAPITTLSKLFSYKYKYMQVSLFEKRLFDVPKYYLKWLHGIGSFVWTFFRSTLVYGTRLAEPWSSPWDDGQIFAMRGVAACYQD